MLPQCQQEDTGNRDDLVIESNSCLSDLLDSLNSPNLVNSMKVLLHLRKKSICFISAEQGSPAENCTRHTARSITCPEGGTPVLAEEYPSPGWGIPQCWGYSSPVLYSSPVPGLGHPLGKELGPETWERTWDWGTPGKDLEPETWERTWDWGTPRKGPGARGLGKSLGLGYPPVWTDKVKTLPCPILRMQAVIIAYVDVFLIVCKLSVSY